MIPALLAANRLDDLRGALAEFTVDGVHELLGPVGHSAHDRGDLSAAARALPRGERLSTLVQLFLLGAAVPAADARVALAPLDPAAAGALFSFDGDLVRARVEVRPYGADDCPDPWWVVSDFGSDVRPGPLADDHVLGIGAASVTLSQATVRRPVQRALDVGTGCGVQALHLSRHAHEVTATDVSERALRLAATTAGLSGQAWELRPGSLLEPVAGERFDTVVANPPFVVSPGLRRGAGGYDYRDSGMAGDEVSATLVRELPALLASEGTASLLANWIVPPDGEWAERVSGWVTGRGCAAWVWQREVVEPSAYVSLWLRDAGEVPRTSRWAQRYDDWLDWFDALGIPAVGMGLITLVRTDEADPVIVCEDVPQPVQQPSGPSIADWFVRQRWLAARSDTALLEARLRCPDHVIRTHHDVRRDDGWTTVLSQLRQTRGMRWELETDDAVAGLVGACDGTLPLSVLVGLLAASTGATAAELATALAPTVRDLVARGFLVPAELG